MSQIGEPMHEDVAMRSKLTMLVAFLIATTAIVVAVLIYQSGPKEPTFETVTVLCGAPAGGPVPVPTFDAQGNPTCESP